MKTSVEIWDQAGMSLFWRSQTHGELLWLNYVEIERVVWKEADRALVRLKGVLPVASSFLNTFTDGDTLYVRYMACGNVSDWRDGRLAMQFDNCMIRRKWIDHPVKQIFGDDYLTFRMSIESGFSLP